MPSPVIKNISPYQKLFAKPPNYLKLRVFDCLCFPWLRPYTQNKLDHRSLPCIFLGYSITQSAYLCHVQFVETSFSYVEPNQKPSVAEPSSPSFNPPTLVLFQSPLVQASSSALPSQDPSTTPSVLPSPAPSVQNEQNNTNGT